jgi:two-component system, OmpR family, response regulator
MKEKKILWIEDDYILLKPLIEQLRKANYLFDFAKDRKEAIASLGRSKYDLIILDIILPEGEYVEDREPEANVGMSLLKYIVSDLKLETAIIIISVINDPKVKSEAEDLGVMLYLNKGSIKPSELKILVDEIFRGLDETAS